MKEQFSNAIFGDMKIDKYPVIVGETSMVFEFVSEGIRGSIPKLVIYSETHLHNFYNFYNLGFGDKDEATGQIDDEVITNNGDSEKVLATVASTLYIFMERYPDAMAFAMGSTKQGQDFIELASLTILQKFRKTLMFTDCLKMVGNLLKSKQNIEHFW